ncbi:MAG TPA: hypothetical protein DD454_02720 [Candidatus Moranbacteria bacterium]|nr:hypothetical protein [Candidatus Moranbacteria bacterium]
MLYFYLIQFPGPTFPIIAQIKKGIRFRDALDCFGRWGGNRTLDLFLAEKQIKFQLPQGNFSPARI